jgi:hypothetical protein
MVCSDEPEHCRMRIGILRARVYMLKKCLKKCMNYFVICILQVQIRQLGLLVQMGITHSMQILQIVLVLYSAGILYRSIWHVLNLPSGTSKMKHA